MAYKEEQHAQARTSSELAWQRPTMVMAEPEETPGSQRPSADRAAATPRRLTVWCKSLVFRGDGYAVFDDADGRMVFRVDNYGVGPGSMALMDHAGRVLLTVRRRQ